MDDGAIIGFNPVNFITVSLMLICMWALVGAIKMGVEKASGSS
jgi:hypothetical protein